MKKQQTREKLVALENEAGKASNDDLIKLYEKMSDDELKAIIEVLKQGLQPTIDNMAEALDCAGEKLAADWEDRDINLLKITWA